MKRGRDLDEGAEKLFVSFIGRAPERLPHLVRLEVGAAVEERHALLEVAGLAHRLSESSTQGGVASILSASQR